jgi:hypothetical protein
VREGAAASQSLSARDLPRAPAHRVTRMALYCPSRWMRSCACCSTAGFLREGVGMRGWGRGRGGGGGCRTGIRYACNRRAPRRAAEPDPDGCACAALHAPRPLACRVGRARRGAAAARGPHHQGSSRKTWLAAVRLSATPPALRDMRNTVTAGSALKASMTWRGGWPGPFCVGGPSWGGCGLG